jgi:aspartate carbamoyltransferase catalytic subunit
MLRLGGSIIGFDNPSGSSVAKGESLKDTIRVVSGYSDVVVIRNPNEGAALASSLYSKVPVINAGDGGHLHPTQTLTDIVTLHNIKGRTENLTIGLCGDLLNGRTVHSLIKTMCKFKGNSFVLISTPKLGLPDYIKELLDEAGCPYKELTSLHKAIEELDVLYMTRIQRERISSDAEYEAQRGIYILDAKKLEAAKPDLCILHPLPRVDEIEVEVDDDPRACYFLQAEYGMFARMALLVTMLVKDSDIGTTEKEGKVKITVDSTKCLNPRCITRKEHYLPNRSLQIGEAIACEYCEHRI